MMLWSMLATAAVAAITFGLLTLRRRFVVVYVAGASMHPAFRDGDRVLVRRGHGSLAVGSAVVLRSPAPMPSGTGGRAQARRAEPPGTSSAASRADVTMQRDVVAAGLAHNSHTPWAIKRVAALRGDRVPESVLQASNGVTIVPEGALVVLSDNPGGTDSRRWGLLRTADVLGTVIAKLPRR